MQQAKCQVKLNTSRQCLLAMQSRMKRDILLVTRLGACRCKQARKVEASHSGDWDWTEMQTEALGVL